MSGRAESTGAGAEVNAAVGSEGSAEPGACPITRIRSMARARQVLGLRGASTQAGFTAEKIPEGLFRRRPLLIADDPGRDERRRELGRFFAPPALRAQHEPFIRAMARRTARQLSADGAPRCLDEAALRYSVAVAARVVGLPEDRIPATARRLERFFTQPPVDYARRDYGRTRRQWIQAAVRGLRAVLGFWHGDVAPAIRAHRRVVRRDPIGTLLAHGAGRLEILAEAMTWATAGMVTTREFITMATWRLLEDPALAEAYRAADADGRDLLLREILRVEPVVGHLYRRVREPIPGIGDEAQLPVGVLADLDVRAANRDPRAVGEDPERIRPGRGLPASRAAGLSFGHGTHRCPGEPLALLETRLLIDELLARGIRIVREPRREEDSLIAGYRLRGMLVRVGPAPAGATGAGQLRRSPR